jgi:enterobactin synthetase component D
MDEATRRCGPISIFLVRPDRQIEDVSLTSGQHPLEKLRAAEIRHTQRRMEFLRSRWLIRQHLEFTDAIMANSDGVIPWPPGLVGSISHKDGIVAFTYAKKSQYLSVGIDLENTRHVKENLALKICSPTELKLLKTTSDVSGISLAELLAIAFSYKESIFKCHFPVGKKWFYFHDAEITHVDHVNMTVFARLQIRTSDYTNSGFECAGYYSRFSYDDIPYVLTCSMLNGSQGTT